MERIRSLLISLVRLPRHIDEMKVNQGRIAARLNESLSSTNIQDYEFKVFSQWGEDGILQRLTSVVPIANRTFIEFGVEDFRESNCRFLMTKDSWAGYVLDGSKKNVKRLQSSDFYWKCELDARQAFVTRENIDALMRGSGFDRDLGILSIDVDGVDYWLLDAIGSVVPRILVVEYNALFGAERKISVPYQHDFVRGRKHYSNLYFGASLPAFEYLARRKGYTLVGTNSAGCNAFFVRSDLMSEKLQELAAQKAYTPARFRESRDQRGRLNFLASGAAYQKVRGMQVVNVETGELEAL
jgi:hypothetical protein